MAACARLQPQNTEDGSTGTTQTCTVKSYERSLRSGHAGMVKVGEFSHFRKQPGGMNCNAEGQFVMFSRSGQRLFRKVPLTTGCFR